VRRRFRLMWASDERPPIVLLPATFHSPDLGWSSDDDRCGLDSG
jgi:hypothetical protein